MTQSGIPIAIYLESGNKKTFATAVDWPGWCRSGNDEQSALQALVDCAPRYAQIIPLSFSTPAATAGLHIVARLKGNATTDFGAPDIQLPGDWNPIDPAELHRLNAIIQACWAAFDQAVQQARGRQLKKGPRGGGRDLQKIAHHVLESEESYLRALGWKFPTVKDETLDRRKARLREAGLQGLQAAVDGQIAKEGPRGGKRWPPRFFVRRLAWHVLDHAWEIEDRIL